MRTQRIGERRIDGSGLDRRRGLVERRATPPATVTVERELRDQEHRPVDIPHRPVEPMIRIFKDAQPDDLVRQVGRVGRVIVASDAHKHEQPVLDGGYQSAIHPHTGQGHTLHDGSHRRIASHRPDDTVQLLLPPAF